MKPPFTDPTRWATVDRVLTAALELPVDEQQAFVRAQCAGDGELLAQLRRLLAAQHTESLLDDGDVHRVRDQLLRDATRDWIEAPADAPSVPRFRIEQELGRGGMGTVFLAARDDGAFEQHVAIKVLRRGVDTDDVLARFRRERQILASFDHPNIARLLDGGVTDDGRSFLVMEYVDGENVAAWCEAHALDLPARLAVFSRICTAVEYAHQRLVVHRDIKPGNILIDRTGTPKLLDFGIAKLLDDTAPEHGSPVTRTGLLYATPRYASPEQLSHAPVTTATDVYQLGVLLYELLAGVHPLVDVEPSIEAMKRALLSDAVRAPSVAANRPSLRGDLDAIVLKAMRGEAAERYSSVAALREDIERHLRGLPVSALVGARWYRVRRMAWRNRGALLLVGAAVATVAAYTLSLRTHAAQLEQERNRAQAQTRLAESQRRRADSALAVATAEREQAEQARSVAGTLRVEADIQRGVAEQERDAARLAEQRASVDAMRAQQTTAFLVDLFRAPGDVTQVRADTVSARTLLERGAERVRVELAAQPEVLGPLLGAIGTASSRLGMLGVSQLFDDEIRTLERAYGANDLRIADALVRQARTHEADRGFASAAERLVAAIRVQRTAGVPDSMRAELLFELSSALLLAERADTAEVVMREALQLRSEATMERRERLVNLRTQLAALRRRQGRLGEADSLLRLALETTSSERTRANLLNNLGSLLRLQERLPEAEVMYGEAVRAARRVLDPTDRDRNVVANNFAGVLFLNDKGDSALHVLQVELTTHRAHFPADHWRLGSAEGNVAKQLRRLGRFSDAREGQSRQVAIYQSGLGPSHPWTLNAVLDLAEILVELGEDEEATRRRADVAARAPAITSDVDRRAVLERLATPEVAAAAGHTP